MSQGLSWRSGQSNRLWACVLRWSERETGAASAAPADSYLLRIFDSTR